MSSGPGRPPNVDPDKLKAAILKRKADIFIGKKLKDKNDDIWKQISEDLEGKLVPKSIHSKMCNTNFKKFVFLISSSIPLPIEDSRDESLGFENNSSMDEDEINFLMYVSKTAFEELIIEKQYKRREANRKKEYVRHCLRLKEGLWENWLSDEIWKSTKFKCGFNFIKHHIAADRSSGSFNGSCHCGSTIHGKFDNSTYVDDVRIDCQIKKGSGKCKKRYFREPLRSQVGRELFTKGADVYRAEQARLQMKPGDPEPPSLPSSKVLWNAKLEVLNSQYLHSDPIKAIEILKHTSMKGTIHSIGHSPFFVHFWASHQTQFYLHLARNGPVSVSIDATGGIFRKIKYYDGMESKTIFLYLIVMSTDEGQICVAHMISESHTAVSITFWLLEWARLGAPHPNEVTCDCSTALLNACVIAFTGYSTINAYANACSGTEIPDCYLRIDVAHFTKIYSDFLKSLKKPKKICIFYKAAIGLLILVKSEEQAKEILTAILTVALCDTDGNMVGTERPTQSEIQKDNLKSRMDPNQIDSSKVEIDDESTELPPNRPESDSIFENKENVTNYWSCWSRLIEEQVLEIANSEKGSHDSAYYLPELSKKLLSHMPWFPLWSCICRDRFGFGRIPASSASVESEMKNIKSGYLRNTKLPVRADLFIPLCVEYTEGRVNIITAKETPSADLSIVSDEESSQNFEKSSCKDLEEEISNKESEDVTPFDDELLCKDSSNKNLDKSLNTDSANLTFDESLHEDSQEEASLEQISNEPVSTVQTKLIDLTSRRPLVNFQKENIASCQLCQSNVAQKENLLCEQCQGIKSAPKILASRSQEDWRGLITKEDNRKGIKRKGQQIPNTRCKSGKISKYLDKNQSTFDALSHDKLKKIPIMKNGNWPGLKGINFGQKMYSFKNTCSFDSIMQIFLIASCDKPKIEEIVNVLADEIPILELVQYIHKNGISTYCYRQRGIILKTEMYKIDKKKFKEPITNHLVVNCEANAFSLATRLLANIPGLEATWECSSGCPPRKFPETSFSLPNSVFLEKDSGKSINDFLSKETKCHSKGCRGVIRPTYTESGPFLFMEPQDDSQLTMLRDIPQSFKDPARTEGLFQLLGVVRYIGPVRERRSDGKENWKTKNTGVVAHYTAICFRQKSWIEFNDLMENPRKLNPKCQIYAALLIFGKQ